MFVYKILEEVNGFYDLVLSRINDHEIVSEHWEHNLANHPDEPMSKYMLDKLDNIAIQKTDITPRQYLELIEKSGSYYDQMKNDTKCMNISDAYASLIVEKVKKTRSKKQVNIETTEKPPKEKKTPKPKPKKDNGFVQIENGKVLNFD